MTKCIIVPLDGSPFEIEVVVAAKGEECLEKACQAVGVIEIDYFGLQYSGPQGELLWLNRRNCLVSQVPGAAPYRFLFRVKFFVPPHLLLKESCRHQFLLQAKTDFEAHKLTSASEDLHQQAAAALQRCHSRWRGSSPPAGCRSDCKSYCLPYTEACGSCSCSTIDSAATAAAAAAAPVTAALADREQASLEYAALKLLAELDGYGYEWHRATIVNRVDAPADKCSAGDMLVAVTHEGVALHTAADATTPLCTIPFATVSKMTQKNQVLAIEHRVDSLAGGGSSSTHILLLGLATNVACGALYRSITERHCFYRCDTVRSVVTDQYSVDLKGALRSLLFSRSLWAKDFCFDVQRTSREAYDHVRRLLFNAGAITSTFQLHPPDAPSAAVEPIGHWSDDSADMEGSHCNGGDTCCICLEMEAVVRFAPCNHRTCCQACSIAIDICPICRSPVDYRQADSCG